MSATCRRVRWCLSVGGSTVAVSLFACSGQVEGTGPGSDAGSSIDARSDRGGDQTETNDPPDPLIDGGKPDVKPPCTDTDPTCKNSCGAPFGPPIIHPPAPKASACSDAQIAALADACATDPTTAGCSAARNAAGTCATCLFGQESDASWKMVVYQPGATPPWRFNQPGCIDLQSGLTGCGKSYFTVLSCFEAFCSECTSAEETACQKDVAQGSGECKPYLLDATCGNALDTVEKHCFPTGSTDAALKQMFINMAAVFCKP